MGRKRTAAVLLVLALVAWLVSGSAVGLGRSLARAAVTEPTTYVANTNDNTITEYMAGAQGNVPSVRSIGGPQSGNTGLQRPVAVAFDRAQTLYVANSASNTITEYRAGASGDERPIRTITGLASPPNGLALDGAGTLYVATYPVVPVLTSRGIASAATHSGSFAAGPQPVPTGAPTAAPTAGPTSTAAPSRTGSILEFQPGANGNARPIRTIGGLDQPVGVAIDRAQHLYVLNSPSRGPGSIVEFAPGASGNATPARTITGPRNGLSNPMGIALDAAQNLYVVNYSDADPNGVPTNALYTGSISEYASGWRAETPPNRTISEVDRPLAIAIDGAGNLYTGNTTGGDGTSDSVMEYAAGALDGAGPIHTITGQSAGVSNPAGVAIAGVPPLPPPPSPATSTASSIPSTGRATPRSTSSAAPSTSTPAPTPITGPIVPLTFAAGPQLPPPPSAVRPVLPSTASPRFQVSPPKGSPGQLVTAQGVGYPPNAEIRIVFSPTGKPAPAATPGPGARLPGEHGPQDSAGVMLASTTTASPAAGGPATVEMTSPPFPANRAGDFVVSFTLPSTSPGSYLIQARSPCCQDQRAPFTLVVASSDGRSHLTQLSQSLPTPRQVADEVVRDPSTLVHGLALAAFMLFVVGFPAELFNKTLEDEENYREVRGWFGWLRRRPRWASRLRVPSAVVRFGSRPSVQFIAFCVAAAAVTALVDPDVLHYCQGGNLECTQSWWSRTLEVFIGFLIAIPVTTLLYAVPEEAVSRAASGQASRLRALPLALFFAAVFAAWSAVGQFLPGYVYGLVAGYAALSTRRLKEHEEGLAVLFGGIAVLAVSVLMWVTWGPVRSAAEEPGAGFLTLTLNATLSQLVVLGLQAVVFGLMPFTFLAGAKLRRWNLWFWGGLYGAAALLYAMVLVISTRETLGKARATNNEAMVIGLFLGFGALSLLFWGYFRIRAHYRDRDRNVAERSA
jgi:hypothetical protein